MNTGHKINRWKQRFYNYQKAFEFLKVGMHISHPTQLEIAGITQAFEFTFELAWKMLKDFLATQGVEANFPRDVLKKSFEYQLIDDGDVWIDMLEKRNLMSHIYEETQAQLAYQLIKEDYFEQLKRLEEFFSNLSLKNNE